MRSTLGSLKNRCQFMVSILSSSCLFFVFISSSSARHDAAPFFPHFFDRYTVNAITVAIEVASMTAKTVTAVRSSSTWEQAQSLEVSVD